MPNAASERAGKPHSQDATTFSRRKGKRVGAFAQNSNVFAASPDGGRQAAWRSSRQGGEHVSWPLNLVYSRRPSRETASAFVRGAEETFAMSLSNAFDDGSITDTAPMTYHRATELVGRQAFLLGSSIDLLEALPATKLTGPIPQHMAGDSS